MRPTAGIHRLERTLIACLPIHPRISIFPPYVRYSLYRLPSGRQEVLNTMATPPILNHDRMDIVEIIEFVSGGGIAVFLALGVLASLFLYAAIYRRATGEELPDRKTRRRLRHRRKHVIIEYERD